MLFTEERIRRFWSKVKKGKPFECWEWIGHKNYKGYGHFTYPGGVGAHRYAVLLRYGHIEKGLVIDHMCRNRACVNPKHLRAVTPRENSLCGVGPAAIHARKTTCKNGHPFDKVTKSGARICSYCTRINRNEYRRKNIVEFRKKALDYYHNYVKLKKLKRKKPPKVTTENLAEMKSLKDGGANLKAIGDRYGITAAYVSALLNGKYIPNYVNRQSDIALKQCNQNKGES